MTPLIQWYPGHIAKAERQLAKNIDQVDLVIEVRDARIPLSTSHPHLKKWIVNKKHLLVINRKDMITEKNLEEWDLWFKSNGETPRWCNAQNGTGIGVIKEAAIQMGEELNQRRELRGMRHRPVRALTLGFPNVGKSALINRLVNKKVVASSRRAGVTKSLQWVRLGQRLDLLDAPGVLPPRLDNQQAALRLAICDDIGQAAYDVESVAIAFLKLLHHLDNHNHERINNSLEKRYGIPFKRSKGDTHQWLENAANIHTSSDLRRMSHKLLDDFRKLLLGKIALELPT
ncbi:ribosome biogenesis GTPase YlqF [Prochlorococcus marinus]|uniref:ribosome biogenesis GTPase YlqF n=1 Tax=Prochlorococcus marinus TaxID=1219 RepID=UPI000533B36A|nr:50S ribosomal subunit maturation GTPase RbgA [Prochlorococcus sp. MIT 0601]